MARGLPDEWDHDVARGWYSRGTEVADKAPVVIDDIHTGRESTRFNPRENLRPADIDWEGYEHTVTALRRTLWQVTGIARTLVDAGDAERPEPAPSTTFLSRYAEALSSMAVAVEQFGLHEEAASAAFTQATDSALDVLTELREEVRTTPLQDPDSWPVYGALISESMRAVHDLQASRHAAVVPTDTDPLRPPPSSRMWQGLRRLGGDRRGQTPTKGSGGALP